MKSTASGKLVMAYLTRVGRALATYQMPVEGRDQWHSLPRRSTCESAGGRTNLISGTFALGMLSPRRKLHHGLPVRLLGAGRLVLGPKRAQEARQVDGDAGVRNNT